MLAYPIVILYFLASLTYAIFRDDPFEEGIENEEGLSEEEIENYLRRADEFDKSRVFDILFSIAGIFAAAVIMIIDILLV